MQRPPGYRFLQIVLVIGAIGFGAIGLFYLASGQTVPGLFALFLAVIEALALPLFNRLLAASRQPDEADTSASTPLPPGEGQG